MDVHSKILGAVERYYSGRLQEFGPTARGVDWNSEASQELRFEQLLKVSDRAVGRFSINDFGCGYGALLGFLLRQGRQVEYRGFDVSPAMIARAMTEYGSVPNATFLVADRPQPVADFTVASGLFNVKLQANEEEWQRLVLAMIDAMNASSSRGFAFNCLTSYSDSDRMRDDLYYADPCALFEHCKRRFSRNVALFHDYGLFEFTIVVRKDL